MLYQLSYGIRGFRRDSNPRQQCSFPGIRHIKEGGLTKGAETNFFAIPPKRNRDLNPGLCADTAHLPVVSAGIQPINGKC